MIGRGFFVVPSRSRGGVAHVVDLEKNEYGAGPSCSCEANRLRLEKCFHIRQIEKLILSDALRAALSEP